ncbi:uncharacterized protein J4E87_000957 [Alternaria ethzedia]|uniref:uncharacterized protein n=1 Tax=Alternaria ethzedia TaxID=181014 RepID=UPI0020C22721|nr:uncharacterized protein J4E87_000957 [Alternaria ethzedia]KAI4633791.1 hypothetical protein J4E87_000957 [Alternaria ethzedia]
MPKLLRCNAKKLERGVNVSELPQLFQDAFDLARALQLPYVWIDALCIIQDDEADKASEVSKMNHIYQNAFLNVGATGAADAVRSPADSGLASDSVMKGKGGSETLEDSNIAYSTDFTSTWRSRDRDRNSAERYDWFTLQDSPTSQGLDSPGFATEQKQPQALSPGLFVDRDPLLYTPLCVTIKRRGRKYDYIVYDECHADDFENSALFKRGWVLQERLLSTRSLFFGQQMVWECSELVACESFPFGFPLGLEEPNVRLGNTIVECKQFAQYKAWRDIVKSFTKCQLTYDLDCFPALSGLARNFQASLQDEYYAGLWKGDFIPGLCWFRDDQKFGQSRYPPFPSDYRAFAPPLM